MMSLFNGIATLMISCEKSGSVVGSGLASAVELLLLSSYVSVLSPSK